MTIGNGSNDSVRIYLWKYEICRQIKCFIFMHSTSEDNRQTALRKSSITDWQMA